METPVERPLRDPVPAWPAGGPAMNRLWPAVLPELRRFAPPEREQALHRARETPLDVVELVGIALGLMAVTALTRYGVPEAGLSSRFARAVLNFAVALPLLAALLGPFHLRRLRRGLRAQLEQRGSAP